MTYERFAYLYDQLMEDMPYEKWVELTDYYGKKHQITGKKLLDLACGTGELSYRFASSGYEVTGIDLSSDMLAIAKAKTEEAGFHIPFYQQNMAELEGLETFDYITIFCDSINYLSNEQEVVDTLEGAYKHLSNQGLFLFDVHSEFKMEHIFKNQTFTLNDENLCYIWNCFEGEFPLSVEHELTFFVKDATSEKYDRIEEYHFQRTFAINQYIKWLEQAGFETLHILGDLEHQSPTMESERILFIAKKKS
ncbi:class I SAM-dependent DNA methyltransferase [Bacillus sp. CGMCC 1.16607]|uniref:class I SAM-dependent DNA methyltransferase n=1 Tax=Bacillus sp. CGMCC 1.16607 TaxID=3351842 RepID=UPI0036328D6F